MRLTLDGMNADQWFTVARVLGELTLLVVLLWFVGHSVRRAFRHLADARRQERERERERSRLAETPRGYLRSRQGGAIRPAGD